MCSTFRIRLPIGNAHLPPESLINEDAADFTSPALDRGMRMVDEVQQWQPADETTTVGRGTISSEVIWQPLLFGKKRGRARIIVADDNAVRACADAARARSRTPGHAQIRVRPPGQIL
jgi:hypothetical protein